MKFTSLKQNQNGAMGLLCSIIAVINMSLLAMNLIVFYNTVLMRSVAEIAPTSTRDIIVKTPDTDADGWHAINVYYGIREPLPPPVIHEAWQSSQVGQDKMVLALTKEYQKVLSVDEKERQNYFVDLAANDATQMSNTYNLEKNEWTGLCVEPNPVYWERLAHRKCTVVAAFVGSHDLQPVNVSLSNNAMAGIVGMDMDNKPDLDKVYTQKYTASLRSVFQRYQVPYEIGYLSLDVEGAESIIMRDFPFDQYFFRFMTVERPKDELRSILKSHGYEYIQDLSTWGETFWVHESIIQKGLTKDKIQPILNGLMDRNS